MFLRLFNIILKNLFWVTWTLLMCDLAAAVQI